MSLKERIQNDIPRCFMREDQFASTHYWNGKEITCVSDPEEALKRKNNNVNDIRWDNNTRNILIFTPKKDFPGGKVPEPNTHIVFDKRPMKVLSVTDTDGMLDIELTVPEPREF